MRLGPHQKRALEFFQRCNGWHSFANDPLTRRVIMSLNRAGLLEINEFQEARVVNGHFTVEG